MADKKDGPKQDIVVDVGFVIVVSIFLVILWSAILNFLIVSRFGSYREIWQIIVEWFLENLWPIILVLSVVISILSIAGIIYNERKLKRLRKEEKESHNPQKVIAENELSPKENDKWESVLTHVESANPANWRQAIIEADVMLDEILRGKGYQGESTGEMLKGVDKSDLRSLESAWEAHKVRNEIAHSGSKYSLNQREAKRVIALFEEVFKELKVI